MARFIADLQIHSKYSRATSQSMILEEIDRWAGNKGIHVMGTGDFTHPSWFKEIKTKLEPAEPGLFQLKREYKLPTLRGTLSDTRFMLEVEISGIYSINKKVYRVHNMIFAPDMETVEKINTQLGWIGNLASDGRPILGIDSREVVKIVLNANPKAVVIPAHIYTPWFSVFGSMSGFDTLEACFGEYTKYIFAVETGLSSDPVMNWRLSQLDNISLISNSDSHSLPRIGREANIFEGESLSYDAIMEAIKKASPKELNQNKHEIDTKQNTKPNEKLRLAATIEFFPEEGKYHFDGHRACGIVFSPEESAKHKNICPKCNKALTIGVLNRVEKLADRGEIKTEFKNNMHYYENRIPFYNLIPLDEVIAKSLKMSGTSRKVKEEYEKLIKQFGGEFNILMELTPDDMKGKVDNKIIHGILAIREGKIRFTRPGFDGEYGIMEFTEPITGEEKIKQSSLF